MLSVDIEKTPFYKMGMREGLQEGIQKGLQKGLQEGLQEGISKGIKKVALSMLKLNVDINIIQATTGLSLEELEKLKKANNS